MQFWYCQIILNKINIRNPSSILDHWNINIVALAPYICYLLQMRGDVTGIFF